MPVRRSAMHALRLLIERVSPVRNIRFGFATNSSSSHSMVYLKQPVEGHDSGGFDHGDLDFFGTNDFRLDTLVGKLVYYLSTIVRWSDWRNPEAALVDIGEQFPEFTRQQLKQWREFESHVEDPPDLTIEALRDPHVIVFGGSDNADVVSPRRAEVVENGLVDWDRTMATPYDVPPREEMAIQHGDKVRFRDERDEEFFVEWMVDESTRGLNRRRVLLHQTEFPGADSFPASIDELELVQEREHLSYRENWW